jgi:hypothetical protein
MKHLYKMNKILFILVLILGNTALIKAQDDKIKFGAYARALQTQNKLNAQDTLNPRNNNTGHVLVDLGININPDKRTEIQAIVRFKSELGGFFGAGTQAQLRQAYVRGIVGKFLNYQVGDLYMKLTPFTFYNYNPEGYVNEARIFSDIRRDYTNYENLSHRGNFWWQQGAHTDFTLDFKETFIKNIRVDGFFLRNRNSFASTLSTFHAGGRVNILQSDLFRLAGTYVNLFDIANTVGSKAGVRNPVTTFDAELNLVNNSLLGFKLFGEGGFSQLNFKGDNSPLATNKKGSIGEAGVGLNLKAIGLSVNATYLYVDPNFFSSAAQTKRINFAKNPSLFTNYGNDPFNPYTRSVTVFDLVRDTALYNPIIRTQLMAYNPIFNNSQPYGKATPNRTGANLGLTLKDSLEKVVVNAEASYLMEVVTAGGSDKRKFLVGQAGIDFNIHKWIGFKKRFTITTGVRYEHTNRGGTAPVTLNSNLIDLGLELEVLKKLDLLVGSKMLFAKGNEFILVRDKYNNVSYDNSLTNNINVTQNLLAFGLKYRFSERTYLTVQDNIFDFKDKTNSGRNYSINQVWMMFNMNF